MGKLSFVFGLLVSYITSDVGYKLSLGGADGGKNYRRFKSKMLSPKTIERQKTQQKQKKQKKNSDVEDTNTNENDDDKDETADASTTSKPKSPANDDEHDDDDFDDSDGLITAAPYDWRLAPQHLESRDKYFTKLKEKIEWLFHNSGGRKVVILAHSMGCKVYTDLMGCVVRISVGL